MKIENFNQYQEEAVKLAVYELGYCNPQSVITTIGGLFSEIAEINELYVTNELDDLSSHEKTEKIAGEIGGSLWYLASVCTLAGIKMDDNASTDIESLWSDNKDKGSFIVKGINSISRGAGRIAKAYQKAARGDYAFDSDKARGIIESGCARVLDGLAILASTEGLTLEEVASKNISELQERKRKGVLTGDGDTVEERLANVERHPQELTEG